VNGGKYLLWKCSRCINQSLYEMRISVSNMIRVNKHYVILVSFNLKFIMNDETNKKKKRKIQ